MQITHVSLGNTKVNNYYSSQKRTNNTVDYQHNNTMLYNTIPYFVPFTAKKNNDISSNQAGTNVSIKDTLNELYPNKPLSTQLLSYHKQLLKEREDGLEYLEEIEPQVDERLEDAGEKIETILTQNGLQMKNILFKESNDDKSKRTHTYVLESEKYPDAKLVLSSSCKSVSDLQNEKNTRIEEFHSDDITLKREETRYNTSYKVNCDLLGETGYGFIYPKISDKNNNFKYSYGFLGVETPEGVINGDRRYFINKTKNITYNTLDWGKGNPILVINQSVKGDDFEEKIHCTCLEDSGEIDELTYTTHQKQNDTKNYQIENVTAIRAKNK